MIITAGIIFTLECYQVKIRADGLKYVISILIIFLIEFFMNLNS